MTSSSGAPPTAVRPLVLAKDLLDGVRTANLRGPFLPLRDDVRVDADGVRELLAVQSEAESAGSKLGAGHVGIALCKRHSADWGRGPWVAGRGPCPRVPRPASRDPVWYIDTNAAARPSCAPPTSGAAVPPPDARPHRHPLRPRRRRVPHLRR